MGLFDIFTAGSASKAAKQNRQAIDSGVATGTAAINTGTANALGLLGTGNGATAFSQLSGMYDRAREGMQGQYGQTQGYLGQIGNLYNPLKQSGQQALSARDDALGLNGAEGYGRAKSAFTNSLGYGAGLDAGLDAVMRKAAQRGNLAGGNTSRDLFEFGADYQNRQAGAYLDRLTGASGNLNAGIAGQAAGLGLQGNASQSFGAQLGSLDETQGGRLMSLYGQGANAYLNQGTNLSNLNSQATQQRVQNNNALSQAKMQASGNLWGLGMNLAALAAGMPSGNPFGSSGRGPRPDGSEDNPFIADATTGWL